MTTAEWVHVGVTVVHGIVTLGVLVMAWFLSQRMNAIEGHLKALGKRMDLHERRWLFGADVEPLREVAEPPE